MDAECVEIFSKEDYVSDFVNFNFLGKSFR